MRKYIYTLLAAVAVMLSATSCGDDWLDVNTDPNNPVNPDIDLLITASQVATAQVMVDRLDVVGVLGQNIESTDSQYPFNPSDFNLAWEELYKDALINIEQIIATAEDPEAENQLPSYAAIAKLQKAYIYTIIVNMWGTAPYEEATLGASGPSSPVYEDGSEIYPKLLTLIDEALGQLASVEDGDPVPFGSDVIYGGDVDRWTKMGNSLKLKLYINLASVESSRGSAVAGINQLIADNNLISSNDDDYQLQFGSNLAPENRHRWHQQHYQGDKTYYMSNFMMNRMQNEFSAIDPRIRYYFYRQISEFDDALASGVVVPDDFPCFGYGARPNDPSSWTGTCAVGYVGNGYTGRDHGDGTGIPNDGSSRTTFGVYPIAGLFDDNTFKTVAQSDGSGAGIYPFITNFMVKFWLAESALLYGTTGEPSTYLEEGMRASISKVVTFGQEFATNYDAGFEPSDADINAYVDDILALYANPPVGNPLYDMGSPVESQLNIILGQSHLANFGNMTESYTNLRRTKYPYIPPANNPNSAMAIIPIQTYPRRLPFAQNELNTNANAPDANQVQWFNTPIFWDTKSYPSRFDGI